MSQELSPWNRSWWQAGGPIRWQIVFTLWEYPLPEIDQPSTGIWKDMFGSHCKVAPESWVIGGSKVVSSKGLEGYEMFDPRNSRREDREEENA